MGYAIYDTHMVDEMSQTSRNEQVRIYSKRGSR